MNAMPLEVDKRCMLQCEEETKPRIGTDGKQSMATVFAVATPKGGSGKTTLSILLAGELAHQGYNTAIIDADPQGSAFQWYATSKQRKIEVPGINVIQASDEDNIRKKVVELDNLDAIVIDLPGFADQRLSNAFLDADLVVIPTKISLLDATQVVRTVRYIHDQAGRLKMKPPNYRAVLNEYDAIERNTSAVKKVAAYFSDNKIKICDAVIFKRPTFRAMTNGYGTLYQMKDSDEAVKRARTNSDHVVRELLSAIEGDEQ